MASIPAHALSEELSRSIAARLRSRKIPNAKSFADEIAGLCMDIIPPEAYDPIEPWRAGMFFLRDEITDEVASALQNELVTAHCNLKPSVPFTLLIGTPGGSIDAGLLLISTLHNLRRDGRRVNAHIQSIAHSMGSILTQCCDVRTIEPSGWMMIHEPSDKIEGGTSALKDQIFAHERYEKMLFSYYANRSGKSVAYWKARTARRDVHLSAQEALDDGLVDAIAPVPGYPRRKRAA